jgi:hypothetical protein
LLRAWAGARLPAVTLTPGGTVNTIARSLAARHGAEVTLERMLNGAAPALDVTRPLVLVEPEDGPARAGLIFVNGVAARWREHYYESDDLGRAPPALVGRIARSGPPAPSTRALRIAPGRVVVDGDI